MIKTLISTLLVLISAILLESTASANRNTLVLGDIIYRGTACPKNSVNVSLLSNPKRINIQFKNFKIQSKGRNKFNDHKTCNLKVPIKVPKGIKISLESADYIGDISLAENNLARMMTVVRFGGKRTRHIVDFDGPKIQRYFLKDQLSKLANAWSGCGQDTMLLLTTSARLKGRNNATSMIGSNSKIMLRLKYRHCLRSQVGR